MKRRSVLFVAGVLLACGAALACTSVFDTATSALIAARDGRCLSCGAGSVRQLDMTIQQAEAAHEAGNDAECIRLLDFGLEWVNMPSRVPGKRWGRFEQTEACLKAHDNLEAALKAAKEHCKEE